MVRAEYWWNTVWMANCAAEAAAFRHAVKRVRPTQEKVLERILRENQNTWYGVKYGFASIRSPLEYQQRVPLIQYEDLRNVIERIADGESDVLTRDPVRLLEPTGGSSQAFKLIPYNASLRKQFQRAIATWVFDVMNRLPEVRNGRAYWSISPLSAERRISKGGIPIGFEDDRDYLSRWQRSVLSRLMVIPAGVRNLRSVDNARYVTALHLLACEQLSLISIWSPTFLTALTAAVPNWLESICEDLRRGQIRLPKPELETGPATLEVRPDRGRADRLEGIFASTSSAAEAFAEVWPRLRLISSWCDAASSIYVPRLRSEFPNVHVQPKGLLATEGVVSFPLMTSPGSVLAVRSHFLEFQEVSSRDDQGGPIRVADELEIGRRYRVILTTGGGLYRYELGDEIEVVDFQDQCPCIRLLGRAGSASDLVGEKLHEQFVRRVLEEVAKACGVRFRFAMVAPVASPSPKYRLFVQLDQHDCPDFAQQIAGLMEQGLKQNPHYRYAIEAKQLEPLDVRILERDGWQVYERNRIQRGQRPGDIKPVVLDKWDGWQEAFEATAPDQEDTCREGG